MDAVFEVLLIIGFVAIGAFNQIRKAARANAEPSEPAVPYGMEEAFPPLDVPYDEEPESEAGNHHPPTLMPPPVPADPEAEPTPIPPIPIATHAYSDVQLFKMSREKKKKQETTRKSGETRKSPLEETAETESEFNVRSIEEVRRAIIWGEILNRKY